MLKLVIILVLQAVLVFSHQMTQSRYLDLCYVQRFTQHLHFTVWPLCPSIKISGPKKKKVDRECQWTTCFFPEHQSAAVWLTCQALCEYSISHHFATKYTNYASKQSTKELEATTLHCSHWNKKLLRCVVFKMHLKNDCSITLTCYTSFVLNGCTSMASRCSCSK